MDRTELAWAAGFWDGEGSAWLAQPEGRRTAQPYARINQASSVGIPEVLVRFREIVGVGRISGPDMKDGREPLFRWVVSSRPDVERLAELVSPWLGDVKRRQLADVIGPLASGESWPELAAAEQRAWSAGLWDGEGSVCLLKHRSHAGYFVPEASVTQSSASGRPEVLERIASVGPGGYLYGPFPQTPPWAPVYRWKVFRPDEVSELIDLIRPWLGVLKRTQAERVFAVLTAQPRLPRGNPAWGSYKTHCVNGHEYATARIRPFKGRGKNTFAPRASHHCLVCLREHAARKRRERGTKERRRSRRRS